MKKYVLATVASMSIAGIAAAQFGGPGLYDTSNLRTISADALAAHSISTGQQVWGSGFSSDDDPGQVTYQSGEFDLDGGNFGPFIGSVSGEALRDDFAKDADAAAKTDVLSIFRFVGGVAAAGQQIAILFLDKNEELVDGFNVTLPQGGNFVWTINLKGAPFEILKPDNGFVQIQHNTGGNVTWFATENLVLGDNQFVPGGATGDAADTMYSFQMLNIPAPGALALLGLAGLVGVRRRRN